MTLPRKNSRSIVIDETRFRYIVSTSRSDNAESFKLNLTVQIESGNGRPLKAEGLLTTRDYWLDFPDVASAQEYLSIEPRHVAAIVRLARGSGWVPEENGAPFLFPVSADIFLN